MFGSVARQTAFRSTRAANQVARNNLVRPTVAPKAKIAPALTRNVNIWAPDVSEKVSSMDHSSLRQQNPGPPPPIENVGVDAVLRENPNSQDNHTTTIFSEFSLEGKTAVISGGNGGLGLEMALAYVEAGANVYAIDIPQSPSEEFRIVAEHCRIMNRNLKYIPCSVTDDAQLNEVMEAITADSGRMDICVAAAGILQTYNALDYPVEAFKKVFDVNTTGVFLTARAAARQMYKNPDIHGSIILIASMSGSIVNRDHYWVAYNASKSAVLQMARNLAAEWGPHDIRVNCISPGHIRTRMTSVYLDENPHLLAKWSTSNPLGRIGRSAEIRGVAVWLASPASSFCNGSDVIVSGGHQIW
ncbi:NAD(P)-binding protein [Jaminaea rosea]|uniref:NAD(P)-binding protein n=1 Tax=Jaminaea rosea TaxID=1569628 RepID=A0A316UY09_9BASI|nr:NAD(P)-binding protein [Jaminaea rosea]PWN30190.1 NAD(P)-binding protein [Jaminaea rosea]